MSALFRLNDSVNTQNVIIWDTERPIQGSKAFIHRPILIAWCTISKYKVVGPYFLENRNVNGEN